MPEQNPEVRGQRSEVSSRFAWVGRSRKATVALGTALSIVLTRVLVHVGLPKDDAVTLAASLVTLATGWILSIAIEDHGEKSGSTIDEVHVVESADVKNAGNN